MNELQIINLEYSDITTWNFAGLKDELNRALSVYKTTAYTDETIKMAKDDKATLNKAKKLVEDQRKAYKAKCLEPYEAIEPQVKEIVSMIEEQRQLIDNVVKDYGERQKKEKEVAIKAYYDKKAFVLGEFAEALYEKLLNQKWLNASTSKSKYEEEIQIAINKTLNDINTIKEMGSPFVDTLIEKYVDTLSVDEVKAKHDELIKAANQAGLNKSSETTAIINSSNSKESEIKTNVEDGVRVKLYGSQSQLNQAFDFMKAIGIKYEIE